MWHVRVLRIDLKSAQCHKRDPVAYPDIDPNQIRQLNGNIRQYLARKCIPCIYPDTFGYVNLWEFIRVSDTSATLNIPSRNWHAILQITHMIPCCGTNVTNRYGTSMYQFAWLSAWRTKLFRSSFTKVCQRVHSYQLRYIAGVLFLMSHLFFTYAPFEGWK